MQSEALGSIHSSNHSLLRAYHFFGSRRGFQQNWQSYPSIPNSQKWQNIYFKKNISGARNQKRMSLVHQKWTNPWRMESSQGPIDEGTHGFKCPYRRITKKWALGLEVADMGQREGRSTWEGEQLGLPGGSGRQMNPSTPPYLTSTGQAAGNRDCLDAWVRGAGQCSGWLTQPRKMSTSTLPAHSLYQEQGLSLAYVGKAGVKPAPPYIQILPSADQAHMDFLIQKMSMPPGFTKKMCKRCWWQQTKVRTQGNANGVSRIGLFQSLWNKYSYRICKNSARDLGNKMFTTTCKNQQMGWTSRVDVTEEKFVHWRSSL